MDSFFSITNTPTFHVFPLLRDLTASPGDTENTLASRRLLLLSSDSEDTHSMNISVSGRRRTSGSGQVFSEPAEQVSWNRLQATCTSQSEWTGRYLCCTPLKCGSLRPNAMATDALRVVDGRTYCISLVRNLPYCKKNDPSNFPLDGGKEEKTVGTCHVRNILSRSQRTVRAALLRQNTADDQSVHNTTASPPLLSHFNTTVSPPLLSHFRNSSHFHSPLSWSTTRACVP